jgi:RNA polymerase sigma-70 factor (ECF subfamily)
VLDDPVLLDGATEDDGDRTLAAAARAGDRRAFEDLVRRHGPALHRYARRMTRDGDAVYDIVRETFIAAWRRIGDFRGESAFRTWLFTICARKVVDSHRVRKAVPIDDRLIEPIRAGDDNDPFATASNTAFVEAMESALAGLPSRQRAVWMLREVEQMTFVQIGQVLHLSPDAARGHHHRARTALQQRLRQWR